MSGIDLRVVFGEQGRNTAVPGESEWREVVQRSGVPYRPQSAAAPTLYRVSASHVAELLASLAPLLEPVDAPSLPVWPPPSILPSRAERLYEEWPLLTRGYPTSLEPPPSEAELRNLDTYAKELETSFCRPGPNPTKIPAYKFSKRGYRILAPEADLIANLLSEQEGLMLREVGAFARVAAVAGGFVVL